jgi:hypothetical protein
MQRVCNALRPGGPQDQSPEWSASGTASAGGAQGIKPGVKRSGTPGLRVAERNEPPTGGDGRRAALNYAMMVFRHPLAGIRIFGVQYPGVPLRFTPGCIPSRLRRYEISHLALCAL